MLLYGKGWTIFSTSLLIVSWCWKIAVLEPGWLAPGVDFRRLLWRIASCFSFRIHVESGEIKLSVYYFEWTWTLVLFLRNAQEPPVYF